MDEPLGAEAAEQPLRDALLQVQVDGVLGQHARVLEDDRPDRRLAAPVGELLARARGARGACRASRPSSGRRRRGGRAAGTSTPAGRRVVVASRAAARRRAARASRRARRGTASLEADPRRASPRAASGSARSARSGLPGARAPPRAPPRRPACAPRRGRPARSRRELRRRRGGGCRRSSRRSMSSSITCERLPSSRLIVSVFLTSTSSTRSSPAAADEVVAADLVGRLELAVDAAVALLHAARDSRAGRNGTGQRSAPGSSGPRGRRRSRSGCAAGPSPGRC